MKRWLLQLQLTTKIVLLVALMGLASCLTTIYASLHMMRIDQQYRGLLDQQAQAVQQMGLASQSLSDITALVQSVLSAQHESAILSTREQLRQLQQEFRTSLQTMHTLVPGQSLELDFALIQSKQTFELSEQVVEQSLRWRGDRAYVLIHAHFTPAMQQVRQTVSALQSQAKLNFQQRSHEITESTSHTILVSGLLGWLTLILVTGLASWLAWNHIVRPITRLTLSMQALAHQDWAVPIHGQRRLDELGTMARTLQDFRNQLHQAEHLKQAVAGHEQVQLLSSQLLELTSALPGAVFQAQISPLGEFQLLFASPQWAEHMGLGAQSELSEVGRQARQHFETSAQSLEPVDFVLPITRADGLQRWIRTLANACASPNGGVTFNGVWLDVSQEVEQAQALEQSRRQTERSAQEKSLLLASISHEIRTPLNAILGLTQLMRQTALSAPDQQLRLEHIWQAGQHLRGIVNEVLDFSKIDAGQMRLESTDFSLRQVVGDALHMCREEASAKGLRLDSQIGASVPDALRGDPHRIAQVLINYLNNAIKFTAAGAVTVTVGLAAGSTPERLLLELRVQDTGPGIPAEQLDTLFEAFQQADSSIARRYGGSGLGLHICQRLAELMGGSTGASSQPGQGSCFWLIAPLTPAQSRPASAEPDRPAECSLWSGRRMLVVDDHPLNRTVLQGLLAARGVLVDQAEHGQQALDMLQAQPDPHYYAAVLMDIQMPVMDGWTAARAIRRLPRLAHLPILAMTANSARHDRSRSELAGMNGHLVKPLLDAALWQALSQCLHQPSRATAPERRQVPAWDPTALDEMQAILPEAQQTELIRQFQQDTRQRIALMQSAASQNDWPVLRQQAHMLAGTAGTFGLMQLGELASSLNHALQCQDLPQIAAIVQAIVQAEQIGMAHLHTRRAAQ